MSVYYKFKTAQNFDTVNFAGPHISVKDLKDSILEQKKFKTVHFDMQISNAETKEVYQYNDVIPKNTSVLIVRVPNGTQIKKKLAGVKEDAPISSKLEDTNPNTNSVDLSELDVPEDEKISVMMAQSTQIYNPNNYIQIKKSSQSGPLPLNYRCNKCRKTGHWIKDCPLTLSGITMIKKSTGIPRSFMMPVEGPEVPGAMINPDGTYSVPIQHYQTYNNIGVESPASVIKKESEIPEDLVCSICTKILSEAVMTPCCRTSFCDFCIRNCLLESEDEECPKCQCKDVSCEKLILDETKRDLVLKYKGDVGTVCRPRSQISSDSEKEHIPMIGSAIPTIVTVRREPMREQNWNDHPSDSCPLSSFYQPSSDAKSSRDNITKLHQNKHTNRGSVWDRLGTKVTDDRNVINTHNRKRCRSRSRSISQVYKRSRLDMKLRGRKNYDNRSQDISARSFRVERRM